MEWMQAVVLSVLGGGFLYLINRIHHVDKLVNETHIRLGILETLLLKTKKIPSKKEEILEPVLNTEPPKNLSQENSKSQTEEFKRVTSERKKILAAKRAEKGQQSSNRETSDIKKSFANNESVSATVIPKKHKARSEEFRQATSERMKAYWAARRAEEEKLKKTSVQYLGQP